MTETPVHWARGGSNSDRIYACPGCVNMAAQYPPEPSGDAAIDGTHTHTLLAYCLESLIWDASTLIGEEMEDHEGKFVIAADRAERAQVALNYVKSRVTLPNCKVVVEEFVDAGSQYGIPQWGGSIDVTLIWDGGYEVIDYKDGFRLVEPTTWQLVTYGTGVRAKYPKTKGYPVRRTVIQPKRFAQPRWVESEHPKFEMEIIKLVDKMRESTKLKAERNPGDHCKYCVGARPGRCYKFNNQARTAMNDIVTNNTPIGAPGPLQLAEIGEGTSDEQLGQMLDMKPLIVQMLDEAEKEAVKRARNGTRFPGRKLVRKTATEKWEDNAEEELVKMRVPKATLYKETLRTPKQIRDSDYFKTLGKRKQTNIEKLSHRPQGSLKLVLESEPGAPVEVGVSKEALANAASASTPVPATQSNQPVKPSAPYQF